jgi:hypothetical protein
MTRTRDSVLAAAVIMAVTAAIGGCGGSGPPPSHTSAPPPAANSSAAPSSPVAGGVPAEPPPAGYQWAGSTAQGVWFAVPDRWAALNLAKISAAKAISRFSVKGVSRSYMKTVLTQLSERHAIFVADLASAVRSPHHFATNGNAFCVPTALTPGASSSPALKAAVRAEYAQIHAQVLGVSNATIDGNPGVKAEFMLTSTAGLTISDVQYVILTKDSRLCYVTLSTDNPTAFRHTFNKIGGSIRVS